MVSSLDEALGRELESRHVSVRRDAKGDASLRVAAADEGVGDLLIWVNAGEIIVGLELHPMAHSHFDEFIIPEDTPPDAVDQAIARSAAEFVEAFLADEYVVEFWAEDSPKPPVTIMRRGERRTRGGTIRRALSWSGEIF